MVDVRELRMSYGALEVLRGTDLQLRRGEVVALLGPNGAGKTTTIEILEGFRVPSGGHVRVLGQEPAHADDAWRARIGMVLQSWRDHPRWRVRELVAHLGEHFRPYSTTGCPRPWDVDDLLSRVGLADKALHKVQNLSGGQRRRLDVAVGLVGRPEVLFLDEPTAGFDPQARRDFHDLIHELSDTDVTVLLTTHDLDEAEKLADRILVLLGGRIVAEGSPDALRRQASEMAEVRWSRDGETTVHSCAYLSQVLAEGPVTDLEVRRATLEDAYLSLVAEYGRKEEVEDVTGRLGPRLAPAFGTKDVTIEKAAR
ncbi:ABC-2 type transport system ATP-binding protein [Austwickia chelonae]|uniref:Putative ABC transporter ATP-binding protein n=1 Tax=Austwickia chelonae NBRC 105200 TaxID=1184607 RepID=K6UNE5_9MICO|nr:putative ABC transporter ATP-binding protein [Austwickia chelonae NBRC 105200]SEV86409.1 ABC-2 type transport system ATP-binding protein [Austwickia chelonae]